MFHKIILAGLLGGVVFVAACGQQSEPTGLTYEPIYNKLGEATGCRAPDGQVGSVTSPNNPVNPCLPPPGCTDGQTTSAAGVICPPPRDGGDDRQPTGTPGTPTTGN